MKLGGINCVSSNKVIHIDLDCFYAAVEIRDDSSLIGKPVAICNSNERNGAVCTCNYIARSYGVKSAMSVNKALLLCPELTILPANIKKYKEISKQISQIYYRFTKIVELISLDEAYLDVTKSDTNSNIASSIAKDIQETIKLELGLSASAGVSNSKLVAKIASDWKKPGGLVVIKPHQVNLFIKNLSVEKLPGVGPTYVKKLNNMGIYTCEDIRTYDKLKLIKMFGLLGKKLIDFSFGIDERKVDPRNKSKSISVEQTFAYDINLTDYSKITNSLYYKLLKRLETQEENKIIGQFIKIRFNNFTSLRRERKVKILTKGLYRNLLNEIDLEGIRPKRLIGIGVNFKAEPQLNEEQLNLFEH